MFNEVDVLHTTVKLTLLLSVGCMFLRNQIGFGLFLGGIMAALALRLMTIDAARLLEMAKSTALSRKDVKRFNRKAFAKRCLLYSAALTTAALSPYLSFFAVFGGLLLPRLSILYHLLRGRITRGT